MVVKDQFMRGDFEQSAMKYIDVVNVESEQWKLLCILFNLTLN